jgi:hypothetical protein
VFLFFFFFSNDFARTMIIFGVSQPKGLDKLKYSRFKVEFQLYEFYLASISQCERLETRRAVAVHHSSLSFSIMKAGKSDNQILLPSKGFSVFCS